MNLDVLLSAQKTLIIMINNIRNILLLLNLNIFFIFNIFTMEVELKDKVPDGSNNIKPDTIINIGKQEIDPKIQQKINKKNKTNFEGEKYLEEVFPIEIWANIARFLEFDDPALVYYLGPRVGLTKKQTELIAQAFYNKLINTIKTKRNFDDVLNLHNNSFEYYRDEKSKQLLMNFIQEQDKYFAKLNSEYKLIHQNLKFSQKIWARFSQPIRPLAVFWIKTSDEIRDKYLKTSSDEDLIKLYFLIINLNKLYKVYEIKGQHLSNRKKIILGCTIGLVVFMPYLLSAIFFEPTPLKAGIMLGSLVLIFMVVCGWLALINKEPTEKFYLKDINFFFNVVKIEIENKKKYIGCLD